MTGNVKCGLARCALTRATMWHTSKSPPTLFWHTGSRPNVALHQTPLDTAPWGETAYASLPHRSMHSWIPQLFHTMGYSPLPLPDMTGQVGSRNVTLALETCLCGCILGLCVTVPLHAHCHGAHFDTLLKPRATPPCTTGTSDSVTPHLCPRP